MSSRRHSQATATTLLLVALGALCAPVPALAGGASPLVESSSVISAVEAAY